jgi:CheY-like chemotaxis protein
MINMFFAWLKSKFTKIKAAVLSNREIIKSTMFFNIGIALSLIIGVFAVCDRCKRQSAATPAAAIELVSAYKPTIVILDLFLTGGSGVEVLRAMGERNTNTHVVVVTNAPSSSLSKACRDLGARFFFDKALEFDQFREALKTLKAEAAGKN